MSNYPRDKIRQCAEKYRLRVIYSFGSRANEALDFIEGRVSGLAPTGSDLDIGVKSDHKLTVDEKVGIAIFFEDLFSLPRVDVVVLQEAPVFLAFRIVTGEVLYSQDTNDEAEYQLRILRMAADLAPFERLKQKMALGEKNDADSP